MTVADWDTINEIESGTKADAPLPSFDRFLVNMLKGRIDCLWDEIVVSCERRGLIELLARPGATN
jgi:hypothetical protein